MTQLGPPLVNKRSHGFLREDDGEHDLLCGGMNLDAGEHFGAPRGLPEQALQLIQALPPFKDQDGTNTCVGHGIVTGAETRLRVQGIAIPPSSRRQVFTLSNQLLRAHKDDPVRADGTYARVAMKACAEFGVAPESDWPLYDEDGNANSVTTEVPPDVLQRASAWKLHEQFTVYETGRARIDTVCAALVSLQPLPCAGRVDTVFEAYSGEGVLPAPDPALDTGGHMVCIIAYRTGPTGKREFLIVNSWRDWGFTAFTATGRASSLAWVSEEWVLAQQEIYRFTLTRGRAV